MYTVKFVQNMSRNFIYYSVLPENGNLFLDDSTFIVILNVVLSDNWLPGNPGKICVSPLFATVTYTEVCQVKQLLFSFLIFLMNKLWVLFKCSGFR